MNQKFSNSRNFGLKGKAGADAPPEVREAHLNTKLETFENLAATAESLGLTHHANRIQRNSASIGRRLNRMREQHGMEPAANVSTANVASSTTSAPTPVATERILMPGIGERINIVA